MFKVGEKSKVRAERARDGAETRLDLEAAMSKRSGVVHAMAFCGLDVSAATLAAAVQPEGSERMEQHEFANTAAGHKLLIAWLRRAISL